MKINNICLAVLLYAAGISAAPVNSTDSFQEKGLLGDLLGHHHPPPPPPPPPPHHEPHPHPGPGGPGGPHGPHGFSVNSTSNATTIEKRQTKNSTVENKGFLGDLFGHHKPKPKPEPKPQPPKPQPKPQPGHGGSGGPGDHDGPGGHHK